MLSGVGIICFAASYAIALALELTRPVFRSAIRGALMLGFAAAGLVAHTAFLYYQAVHAAGLPLSSEQDWYLVAAWAVAVVYIYLTCYHPKTPFGLLILPLVLLLIGVATFLADPQPYARGPASAVWGVIHGTSILLATVSVLVGFTAGVMYLHQAWRLRRKRASAGGLRLPSLEWLQKVNSRSIVIASVMLGAGVLSGLVLRGINPSSRFPWYDPVMLGTTLMFFWLAAATVMEIVYRPASAGRKVAYLTVVSFVFLVVALAVGMLLDTQHGGGNRRSRAASATQRYSPCGHQWLLVGQRESHWLASSQWHPALARRCDSHWLTSSQWHPTSKEGGHDA